MVARPMPGGEPLCKLLVLWAGSHRKPSGLDKRLPGITRRIDFGNVCLRHLNRYTGLVRHPHLVVMIAKENRVCVMPVTIELQPLETTQPGSQERSEICPGFPARIEL